MKRVGGLWPRITRFDNLYLAYCKARRGKSNRPEVAQFSADLEKHLLTLQFELQKGAYRPGLYRLFTLYERKPRLIAAAPFRDRVVHHAVINLLEPALDKRFIHHSYACRKGKGVHRAVDQYQRWASRYAYCAKIDIQRYFPSIDQQILKTLLHTYLKEKPLLELLDLIIDSGPEYPSEPTWYPGDDLLTPLDRPCGIPIGNLTSQFFANLYLDKLDHSIKEVLGAKAYLRYVDDMLLLSDEKTQLWAWVEEIDNRLESLRLRLHTRKQQVYRTTLGVDVLGYQVFPDFRRLRNDNGYRFARKLRALSSGYYDYRLDWDNIHPRIHSWIGHAGQADTQGLRRKLFGAIIFKRGPGRTAASV